MGVTERKKKPMAHCKRCNALDYLFPDDLCMVCRNYIRQAMYHKQKKEKKLNAK